jgi:ribosomal protein L37E
MVKCNKCGYENKEENNYCSNCGYPLKQTPQETKVQPQISTKTMVIGLLVFFLLIGIIWGAIWWWTFSSTPSLRKSTFHIVIESDTSWMGSIGGDGSSKSISGYGSATYDVTGYIVSAAIQKQTSYGYLTVKIVRDGKILDSQTTTAPYGVVTVSASS